MLREMLLSVLILGAGCGHPGGGSPLAATEAPPSDKITLELRLAEKDPGPELTRAVVVGTREEVYLHQRALFSKQDITCVALVLVDDCWCLSLRFSQGSPHSVWEVTRRNIGRRIALVLDGEVIAAPAVVAAIPGHSLVFYQPSEESARKMFARLTAKRDH